MTTAQCGAGLLQDAGSPSSMLLVQLIEASEHLAMRSLRLDYLHEAPGSETRIHCYECMRGGRTRWDVPHAEHCIVGRVLDLIAPVRELLAEIEGEPQRGSDVRA